MTARLKLSPDSYERIIQHLQPRDPKTEEAGFVFAMVEKDEKDMNLEYRDWYPVKSDEFEARTDRYFELTDECRARVIKMAHDIRASLVEFHSHLYQSRAGFSGSDLFGFGEFVPHVMWRLKGRPYTAVVVAKSTFDAIIWAVDPRSPETLSELIVGGRILRPTGATLRKDALIEYDNR